MTPFRTRTKAAGPAIDPPRSPTEPEPFPSDLFDFRAGPDPDVRMDLNDEVVLEQPDEGVEVNLSSGYLAVRFGWCGGDEVSKWGWGGGDLGEIHWEEGKRRESARE